jgi:outer membrane protein assembly factor BamD (BamD/ComL family)
MNALYSNGETFQNKLEDFPSAIDAYDELLRRFGMFKKKEQTLFNLYYCSMKAGLQSKADSAKNALNTTFGDGDYTNKLRAGNNNDGKQKDAAVTKKYENIYSLFVEGKFEEAKREKAKADAQYSNNYWTPQLLYIEAVYYIKQRSDDTAINKLQSLTSMFPKSPLVEKARTMIDVLKRRTEIETYLTNLKIERAEEDEVGKGVDLVAPTTTGKNIDAKTNDIVKQPAKELKPIDKAIETKPAVAIAKDKFSFIATDTQYVMVVLDKVDRVFISEAKSAYAQYNRQRLYNQVINISTTALNDQYTVLLLGPFADASKAMEYIDRVRPVTATQILNWLSADKYTYSIISNSNFEVLRTNKEVTNYQQLLKQALPGKF